MTVQSFVVGIFISIWMTAEAKQGPCSPIGQLVKSSKFTAKTIDFRGVPGEPKIENAAINSPTCTQSNFRLDNKSYIKLQVIDSTADRAFVILQKSGQTEDNFCLTGVFSADEVFARRWQTLERPSEDACTQKPYNLIKIISSDGVSNFYVNHLQAELLTSQTLTSPARSQE